MNLSSILLLASSLLALTADRLVVEATTKARSLSRELRLVNDSGESVSVDWIHPVTGEQVPYSSTSSGDTLSLQSYVNHTFVIHTTTTNATCRSDDCAPASVFTIGEESEPQVIVVKKGLQVERRMTGSQSTAEAMVEACRSDLDRQLARGLQPRQAVQVLTQCMETKTAQALMELNEELAFHSQLRKELAAQAENYTCADLTMETTQPLYERQWTHDGVQRTIGILHERPASQIHLVENFITREECDAIQAAAKPSLHRGTVANGKGGSRLSDSRKAWQAGITPDWDKEAEGDLIAGYVRRVFAYANHATGYNMTVGKDGGQEDLMSIQYYGNGLDDERPDRYTPHCDGDCDSLPHTTGSRVATIVAYCDVPEVGGATNFMNANVYVKAKAGAAAFFSYMDPKTMVHDEGFTTHSGCPVLLGTKRIAVQWMRVGVDKENPWDSFDTNNVKIRDQTDDEEECDE